MGQLTENQQKALRKLFEENDLIKDDVYEHKHYIIITRSGIEKIQYKNKIDITFEVIVAEPDFAVVKATAKTDTGQTIETFGSAKRGGWIKVDGKNVPMGNTDSWYVMEIAEKRALSRAVLKSMGLYEHKIYGAEENLEEGHGLD